MHNSHLLCKEDSMQSSKGMQWLFSNYLVFYSDQHRQPVVVFLLACPNDNSRSTIISEWSQSYTQCHNLQNSTQQTGFLTNYLQELIRFYILDWHRQTNKQKGKCYILPSHSFFLKKVNACLGNKHRENITISFLQERKRGREKRENKNEKEEQEEEEQLETHLTLSPCSYKSLNST